MGYDHFWERPKELDCKRFSAWACSVKKIVESVDLELYGPGGDGLPLINSDVVWFGHPDVDDFRVTRVFDLADDENYLLENGMYWFSCRTNPGNSDESEEFDTVVAAALATFKHHFIECRIESDGDLESWQDGIALCNKILGYGEFPCDDAF